MKTDVTYRDGNLEINIDGETGAEYALLNLLNTVGAVPHFVNLDKEKFYYTGCKIVIAVPQQVPQQQGTTLTYADFSPPTKVVKCAVCGEEKGLTSA